MFSRIRKRFTYTNIVMTLALVFAMSGGAYAASKYLITSTKQISPKVLKSLKGKNGTNGAQGAQGAQGPAGANGKDGTNGTNGTGTNGTNGTDGTNGKSVVLANGASGCTTNGGAGGTSVEVEGTPGSKKYVCNGSPWTAGGTLPAGATETGGWAVGDGNAGTGVQVYTAISFSIPLAAPVAEANVQANVVGFPTGASTTEKENCPGTVTAPKAKTGFLCVYTGVYEHASTFLGRPFVLKLSEAAPGTDTAGASVGIVSEAANATASGTWAVTG
jgi:hypothetical protein